MFLNNQTIERVKRLAVAILCEKPSARRNMATALGGVSGTYNGESYFTTNLVGHVYEFKKPDKQVGDDTSAKYASWTVGNLPWDETDFKWTYDMKPKVGDVIKAAKAVIAKCDEIAIATDWDKSGEGDLLAWEFIINCGLTRKKITRMHFVDESVDALRKAFRDRVPASTNDPNYRKALYRSQWDFMSMQFTRVATAFGDGSSLLRQGRLKSAIIYLIGSQLELVNGYKKIPYYQNRFVDENGVVYTNPDEPTFPDKSQVPQIYTASQVACDKKELRNKVPPMFWTLSTLSAKVATEGIKPAMTAKLVQAMYEDQVVSYPRTDDKTVTPDQFSDMLPIVDSIARVVGVDPGILTHRQPRGTHVKAKGAHGANRPGMKVPASLAMLDGKYGKGAGRIYELLAKSYLACMAEDYQYEFQKGHVADYPKFIGSTSIAKSLGWKAVYGADLDDDDEAGKGLGSNAKPFVFEGFPPKPQVPTVKWLVEQLTKRDIGTGATQNATIAQVSNDKDPSQLVIEKRGKLTLTESGEMSFKLLPGTYIGSLDVTKTLQDEMEDIADNKKEAIGCLHAIQDMVRHDIEVMKKNGEDMRKSMGITYSPRPTSNGGNGAMGSSDDERFSGKWKGKDINPKRVFRGHRFTDDEVDALLAGSEIECEFEGKNGTYKGIVKIDNSSFKDAKGKTVKYTGVVWVGFANSGGGGGFDNPPKKWASHEFTEDELAMLKDGATIALVDVVSKKGNTFDCHVRWDVDPDNPKSGRKKIICEFD